MRSAPETKHPKSACHHKSAIAPEVLSAGSPKHVTPHVTEPQISDSAVRFGAGSDFGFHKPSRFFDLTVTRSESPTTGFGIGSVSVVRWRGARKSRYISSAFYSNNKGSVGLIIPWSQVRVLAGPPLPIKIIVLCRWDQGIIVPWCSLSAFYYQRQIILG
jgi:hypothetical protein